ncbi:MAG TPA: cupin domain-containing protein [Mucilaginibacter sp.]|jgi:mannose-6-phosphate isomerase-like protein (cupin superfamily)
MTKRDFSLISITALVMCIPLIIVARKSNDQAYLPSTAYDWKDMKVTTLPIGERRQVFDSPTQTLDRLELHITTLNPGDSSHAPHQHPNEELLIVKEGTVWALVNGQNVLLGPGSVVYQAANRLHNFKNAGKTKTTYYALQWRTPKTGKAETDH